MYPNGLDSQAPDRPRVQISRWTIRLLIALILGIVLAMAFFTSSAISH